MAFSTKGDAVGIHYVATGATSDRIEYSLLTTLVSDPNGGRHSKVIGLNSNNTIEAKCTILNDASSITSNVFVLAPSTTLAGYPSVGKEDITKEHPKLGQYCKEDDVTYRIAMVPLCMLITKTSHPVRGKANENTIGALEQTDDDAYTKDVEALQKKLDQATAPTVPPGVPLTIQTTAAASVMDSAIPRKDRNKYLGTLGMAGEPINIDDATAGKYHTNYGILFLCISHAYHFYHSYKHIY